MDRHAEMSRRNRRTLAGLLGIVGVMAGLSFAAVPLYELFCRATGFNGTPQQVTARSGEIGTRLMIVRFNADVSPSLPWQFAPVQRQVTVRVGEEALVFYRATNLSAVPIVGTAVYNVTPEKAGGYFDKLQCFCFTEQVLKPGESVDMPVVFFIDPAIVGDANLDDVSTVTLSYTFFEAKSDRARQLLSGAPAARDGVRKAGGS